MKVEITINITDKDATTQKYTNKVKFEEKADGSVNVPLDTFLSSLSDKVRDGINKFENILG